MLFFRSLWKVIIYFSLFLSGSGLLAGIADDVPGLNDEPAVQDFLTTLAWIFKSAIHALTHYPIGSGLFFLFCAGMHCLYTLPAELQMEEQVRTRRTKKPSKKGRKKRSTNNIRKRNRR